MVIDRKRGLNVQRETWVGAKLMEGGIGWGGGRKVQYGERVDRQREKRERKKRSYCRQSDRRRYTYLRKDSIRGMACLQINWN